MLAVRNAGEKSYLWEYFCKGKEDTRWSKKPRHLSPTPAAFVVLIKSLHLYALLSGKTVLSEMFHFSEVLDFFSNIYFAEECKCILMTSVPDGRGITGTHVALDQGS